MTTLAFRLDPLSDLSGTGPRWLATTREPWFRLAMPLPASGSWLRLVWRAGLGDPVARPVLRCLHEGGQTDLLLPAAPLGRKEWIGLIPQGTQEIRLSPTGRPGPFGFVLERVETVSLAEVLMRAARNNPLDVLHAIGAALIGRRDDFRAILDEALAAVPFHAYPRWRENGFRPVEPNGVDGAMEGGTTHVVQVISALGAGPDIAGLGLVQDLQAQPIAHWRLILTVPESEIASRAGEAVSLDARIRILPDTLAIPDLLDAAGDAHRVALLPEGARLSAHTLIALRGVDARNPAAAVVFSDEERITPDGRATPVLKPAFDPLMMGKVPHLGHAAFWSVEALKGALAATPPRLPDGRRMQVEKISRPLVALPSGTQSAGLIEQALILPPPSPSALPVPSQAEIAIIIPTRDRLDLLRPCIESVLASSEGRFRLVILDNDSVEARTLAYFDQLANDQRFVIHRVPGAFNFSKLCNIGATLVESEILLFLNNDTTVLTPTWLAPVRRFTLDPAIGAVGAKLLYPAGDVQHGGVIAGLGGRAGHIEPHLAADSPGFFGRASITHSLSAVTGACLAVERRKFEEIGGFDAINLPIDLNDIDLCFRLGERGYRTVLAPDCLLCHHESASRGRARNSSQKYASERAYFSARWLQLLRHDPYFNPVLSLYASHPRLG